MQTKLLSQSDIEQVLTMKDAVEIVDRTFKDFGEGKTINPPKVGLDLGEKAVYPSYEGFMNAMPAYVGWLDSAGIKWAGGILGERKKRGLPYITSLILLMDPRIGNFRAVMDGALITNWRTGAQTAVALKYLHKDKSIRLSLYGAGMQGHTQTMAISEYFDIEEIRVYDINRPTAKTFAENMQEYVKGEINIADTPEEAVGGDVIVCVTQSRQKFVKNDWVRPGTILFPMGSYQECENEFILGADKIIVDHVEQCLHRGALKELAETEAIGENDIYATIGEIAAGKKQGQISKTDRVLCIPIGTGAMDVAIATVVLERATEKKLGDSFAFV